MHKRTELKLSKEDRAALQAAVANRNSPQKHIWRAKIVLLTVEGHGTAEIKGPAGNAKTVIWRWQERVGAECRATVRMRVLSPRLSRHTRRRPACTAAAEPVFTRHDGGGFGRAQGPISERHNAPPQPDSGGASGKKCIDASPLTCRGRRGDP